MNTGAKIPIVGLGTWAGVDWSVKEKRTFNEFKEGEVYKAVSWALKAGYRHIDTASYYHNEEDVG